MSDPSPRTNVLQYEVAAAAPSPREPWGWIELFVLVQLLWGAFLFLPGAQPYRMAVRALPYVASLGAFAFSLRRRTHGRLPTSARWLLAVFGLLLVNLLHSETRLNAGLAQVVFQISVAAPMFWVAGLVQSPARLSRLVSVIFVASSFSALVGVLQVYYPTWFLPPEFSALARSLSPTIIGALSYIGPNGQLIVRPPGISDLPGGAALAGLTTVVLGIGYASHSSNSKLVRVASVGAAAIGMTALYLTQVRSLTVMAAFGVLVFAAIRLRQGHFLQGGWIVAGGVSVLATSFMWASAIGGKAVQTRFFDLLETGLFISFRENRGLFLDYTFRDLLFQFPLGAGLGRWGMMQVYFPDPAMWQSPPIHVEIQPTGWLLDGGLPMWICYGAALVSAVALAYRAAVHSGREDMRHLSGVVIAFQLSIIGLCLTGPVFNTQLGVLFWTVTGALFGAVRGAAEHEFDESDAAEAQWTT